MSADTKIIVRVLRTHAEDIEVYATTLLEAEKEVVHMQGVIEILDSYYADNSKPVNECEVFKS